MKTIIEIIVVIFVVAAMLILMYIMFLPSPRGEVGQSCFPNHTCHQDMICKPLPNYYYGICMPIKDGQFQSDIAK